MVSYHNDVHFVEVIWVVLHIWAAFSVAYSCYTACVYGEDNQAQVEVEHCDGLEDKADE